MASRRGLSDDSSSYPISSLSITTDKKKMCESAHTARSSHWQIPGPASIDQSGHFFVQGRTISTVLDSKSPVSLQNSSYLSEDSVQAGGSFDAKLPLADDEKDDQFPTRVEWSNKDCVSDSDDPGVFNDRITATVFDPSSSDCPQKMVSIPAGMEDLSGQSSDTGLQENNPHSPKVLQSMHDLPITSARTGKSRMQENRRSMVKQGGFSRFTDIVKGAGLAGRQAQGAMRSLWRSGHSSNVVSSEDLSKDDVIIALMGPTGVGKSSFIKTATGAHSIVGHELHSCTNEIGMVKVRFCEKSDFDVVFVDTPGFDDTNKSDGEILQMIAHWLKITYERDIKLSGILYLHRISDNRMAGTPLKNLRIFKELCGKNALQNIIFTTTMWDEVSKDEGSQRESELKAKYWRTMISEGSKVVRYLNSSESAWNIVDPILRDANQRSAVELQREMVELQRQLPETKAGQELYGKLDALFRQQRETLRRIRAETERSENRHMLDQLKVEYDELRKRLETTINDMHELKLPLRKRFIRMLLSPLGLVRVTER